MEGKHKTKTMRNPREPKENPKKAKEPPNKLVYRQSSYKINYKKRNSRNYTKYPWSNAVSL